MNLNYTTKNYDSNMTTKDQPEDSSDILSSGFSKKTNLFTKLSNIKSISSSNTLSKSTYLTSFKNSQESSTNKKLKEMMQNFTGFSKNKFF